MLVTAASVFDTAAGVTMLIRFAAAHPQLRTAWVDTGYRTTAITTAPVWASTSIPFNAHPALG
ncbi:hypothetical protein ACFW9I_32200 [[Kitasatospora] papulosa]|uniref:hypothetical protein n=1 Tax=[Kitasatospora] papulosa TaxID=1464011 RepID=UPI00368DDA9A